MLSLWWRSLLHTLPFIPHLVKLKKGDYLPRNFFKETLQLLSLKFCVMRRAFESISNECKKKKNLLKSLNEERFFDFNSNFRNLNLATGSKITVYFHWECIMTNQIREFNSHDFWLVGFKIVLLILLRRKHQFLTKNANYESYLQQIRKCLVL